MSPNKTIYIKPEHEEIWERAENLPGVGSLSSLLTELVRDYLVTQERGRPVLRKYAERVEKGRMRAAAIEHVRSSPELLRALQQAVGGDSALAAMISLGQLEVPLVAFLNAERRAAGSPQVPFTPREKK